MRAGIALAFMALPLIGAGPALAQQTNPLQHGPLASGSVVSPVLVIDMERMFRDSAFGQRARLADELRRQKLRADNQAVAARLAQEEEDITKKRATMEAEAFRALADAFDKKVQETREAQFAKERDLVALFDKEREVFLASTGPILERLIRESGALVILERPLVVASVSQVDITDRAIALLDETIGVGAASD